eukprot:jgi/Mesen1/144/ME1130167C07614
MSRTSSKSRMSMQRPAYKDGASPRQVSTPVMLALGAAALLGGVFITLRTRGRRVGSGSSPPGGESRALDDPRPRRPTTLAELRSVRAKAAEARLVQGPTRVAASAAATSAPTPLGQAIAIAQQVAARH